MIITKRKGQSFIYRSKWEEIKESIKEKWDEDYFITDFDYGDGMYRVLLSSGTGWSGQAYRWGKEFPSEKVKELWAKDYHITNVTYDGSDWIVVMSGNTNISGQKWFTRSSFTDFEKAIDEAWKEGYVITKIAFGNGTFLGVMSKGLGWSQTWWHWNEFPTDELMQKKQTEGKIITDVFAFGDKVFAVASGNTGLSKQRFHKSKDFDYLIKLLKNRWDEGYTLTSVSFYKGEWILIVSK
jgi:hypothetical protein